jgi:hypothetical protein
MATLALRLPDDKAERLAELARRLNVSVEELATAGVLDLLAKPDERFEEAARYVLQKNAELYQRLA